MKNKYLIFSMIFFLAAFNACQENARFEISGNDKEAPAPPEYLAYKPLTGGARIFYNTPKERDILSIDAEYENDKGKKFHFSASYFTDSLDVMGFADTLEHVVNMYAVDRAGNCSNYIPIKVKASGSAVQNVAKSIKILPSFNSFIITWDNELRQTVNVYVDMLFDKQGERRERTWVLSSNNAALWETIDGITLADGETLSASIRLGDTYGNMTSSIDMGKISVMSDEILSKDNWRLPNTNDSIAGVPMCFGNGYECRSQHVIDGIISIGSMINIMHTDNRGRTGRASDGNAPWNFLIDLGDYYELSRIVTNQRHDFFAVAVSPDLRGHYYMGENVNQYNMYFLDEETGQWEYISQHTIPVPTGLSNLEFAKKGFAGDMALMYPETPRFTRPARWFRYEAISGFDQPFVLSELTLYGRKANK
ncbi:MAG: DUF4959 domain-containing protein [Dysgonamonadaceae bacterium]|jgi:hypothetical protein|nr:DUF4959 domain-containing protein [Dysgonamonadaceae bacterium]